MRQKGKFRKLGFPTLTLGSRYYLSQLVCHVTETRACKHRWLWLIVWLGKNQANASFRKLRPPISIVGFKRFINRREANLQQRISIKQNNLELAENSFFEQVCVLLQESLPKYPFHYIFNTKHRLVALSIYLYIRCNFLGLADDIYLLQSILFQRFISFSDYPKAKLFSLIL